MPNALPVKMGGAFFSVFEGFIGHVTTFCIPENPK